MSPIRPGSHQLTATVSAGAPVSEVVSGEAGRVAGAAAEPPSLDRLLTRTGSEGSAGAPDLNPSPTLNRCWSPSRLPAEWWKSTRTSSSERRARIRDRAVGAASGWDAAPVERVTSTGRVLSVDGPDECARISGDGKGLKA